MRAERLPRRPSEPLLLLIAPVVEAVVPAVVVARPAVVVERAVVAPVAAAVRTVLEGDGADPVGDDERGGGVPIVAERAVVPETLIVPEPVVVAVVEAVVGRAEAPVAPAALDRAGAGSRGAHSDSATGDRGAEREPGDDSLELGHCVPLDRIRLHESFEISHPMA
jgi:hypothetical protein